MLHRNDFGIACLPFVRSIDIDWNRMRRAEQSIALEETPALVGVRRSVGDATRALSGRISPRSAHRVEEVACLEI